MREHPTAPKILVQVGFVVTSVFFPALRYPTLLGTAVLYHAIKAKDAALYRPYYLGHLDDSYAAIYQLPGYTRCRRGVGQLLPPRLQLDRPLL
jgi:hypothetical protein